MKTVKEIEKEISKLEREYYQGRWAYSDYIRNRHELTMKIYKLTAPDKAYCHICGECKTKGCEHYEKN